jgi:hypothetical protein
MHELATNQAPTLQSAPQQSVLTMFSPRGKMAVQIILNPVFLYEKKGPE